MSLFDTIAKSLLTKEVKKAATVGAVLGGIYGAADEDTSVLRGIAVGAGVGVAARTVINASKGTVPIKAKLEARFKRPVDPFIPSGQTVNTPAGMQNVAVPPAPVMPIDAQNYRKYKGNTSFIDIETTSTGMPTATNTNMPGMMWQSAAMRSDGTTFQSLNSIKGIDSNELKRAIDYNTRVAAEARGVHPDTIRPDVENFFNALASGRDPGTNLARDMGIDSYSFYNSQQEAAENLQKFIMGSDSVVGHNIRGFDAPVLSHILGRPIAPGPTIVDTLSIAEATRGTARGRNKLSTIAAETGYTASQTHLALDDVKMLKHVADKLTE